MRTAERGAMPSVRSFRLRAKLSGISSAMFVKVLVAIWGYYTIRSPVDGYKSGTGRQQMQQFPSEV